jgi:pSer/pThr/pTyr-binding forkhead associated (FHA) protein|mmetsp:Transcript_103848/g.161918  ORF Transcript_103848/g.161918 Transcript_103848/m.161918 type:complete len:881 (+) Transcript_103848:88-2730(+)
MPKFLNWNKKLSRSSGASGSVNTDRLGGSKSSKVGDGLPETFERLHHICKSSESHPFVKPFGNMVSIVEQAVRDRPAPFPVGPAMHAVLEFLEQSLNPAARLNFAFMVTHSTAATRQFLGDVGGALAVLADVEDHLGLSSAVKAMLEQWSVIGETFTQRCREVWELYIYFTFLDIKGDRALIQQALNQFCELLDCSPIMLRSNLENSRSSAETVLCGLADKGFQPILENMHRRFLQEWHLRCQEQDYEVQGNFWQKCFNSCSKVEWTDFLDALQAFSGRDMLPTDVANQLWLTIDPALRHHISSLAWTDLLEKHGSIAGVLEVVTKSVLESITTTIYRTDKEIRSFDHHQRSMCDDNGEDFARGRNDHADEGDSRHETTQKDSTHPGVASSIAPASNQKASSLEDPSTAVTPPDRLSNLNLNLQSQTSGTQRRMTWEEYKAQAQRKCHSWWHPRDALSVAEERAAEKLRVDATRVVKSSIICTDRALLLHIQTGSLASNHPIVETGSVPRKQAVPAVVVMANGGRHNGITTFGRGSARNACLSPDHELQEPIASRSHFAITYDQREQRYCLRDTGSKWGTFLNIGSGAEGRELNCGDWIRAGVAEFIVRHCGGGCSCHKRHARYRIQSLRLSRQYSCPQFRALGAVVPRERPHVVDPDSDLGMSRAAELQDELALLFSRRRQCGWTTTSTQLCHTAASRSPRPFPKADDCDEAALTRSHDNEGGNVQFTSVPTSPLELEFVSGPRMGERVVLWDRLCSLGRGEQNTIQVSDANIANVSRVHCIFEYVGKRWRIRDNKSTNGTWRRLSCILQPSEPMPLVGGEVILAGTHEIKVEEVRARSGRRCLPSVATTTLAEMCQASNTGDPSDSDSSEERNDHMLV